ncbi:MAG: hypothetical protein COB46_10140 [Rhodospirillaceae bacterium]|nr:MAG: hypothetical protein COB46_10140 [Rhodospirillaceae bacterium]
MTPEQKSINELKSTILSELSEAPSLGDLIFITQNTYMTIDHHIDLWKANDNPSFACQSGCGHCCFQAVWVTEPEVILLAEAIRNQDSPLLKRAAEMNEITKSMDLEERKNTPVACPFLYEDKTCFVYEVRPVACRFVYSNDETACINDLQNRTEGVGVFSRPIDQANQIRSALVSALYDIDLHCHTLDLNAALTIAMVDPSAGERWLNGENSFEKAIAPDQTVDIIDLSRGVTGDI